MKILMLVNWKVKYCDKIPDDKQPPDYYVKNMEYWFFRYFKEKPEVDVVDISSFKWLENFEHYKIRFYIWQTLKILPKLKKYDLVVSHGMQSGIVLSLWRRLFNKKIKHIVFDIGAFNSASESGIALKVMQFASKSIDGIIYHTSSQIDYYKKHFPWLVDKSKFIRFGTDLDFFSANNLKESDDRNLYFVCVGASKRDWNTLVEAYKRTNTNIKLRIIGNVQEEYSNVKGVEQLAYIPVKDLINQIYNARFCVLPLKVYNYSYGQMTFLQQIAMGKAVLAARTPSLIDYGIDGETNLFYEAENVEDCYNKLNLLLNDIDLCKRIAYNGKKYLKEYCKEEIMAGEIEEFIKEKFVTNE